MSVTDQEFSLSQISDLISPNKRINGNRPILADERLALTLRYLARGESFQSISYQFQIYLVAISYIVKERCSAINVGYKKCLLNFESLGKNSINLGNLRTRYKPQVLEIKCWMVNHFKRIQHVFLVLNARKCWMEKFTPEQISFNTFQHVFFLYL